MSSKLGLQRSLMQKGAESTSCPKTARPVSLPEGMVPPSFVCWFINPMTTESPLPCLSSMKCAAIAAIMAPESDEAKPKVEDDSSPKGPNGPKPLTFGEKQGLRDFRRECKHLRNGGEQSTWETPATAGATSDRFEWLWPGAFTLW